MPPTPERRLPPVNPVVLTAVAVILIGVAEWLLMRAGRLDWAIGLLVLVIVVLLVLAVRAWRRAQRKAASALLVVAVLITAAIGCYGILLNSRIGNIGRIGDEALAEGQRPEAPEETGALNLLLMGTDGRPGAPTLSEALADDEWKGEKLRSDTLMLVRISANRKRVTVVSIPRDTYTTIYSDTGREEGKNKINQAFADGGPYSTWRTVENFTGLRIDHMAAVGFEGFRDLTTAVGGVDVYIPKTFEDYQQHVTWEKGWKHLEGDIALKYVRTRHGLSEGDFDRVARQQNFLRTVLEKMIANETMGSPQRLLATVDAVSDNLTVDEGWSNSDIRSLALGLRGVETKDIAFVTLPLDHYESIDGVGDANIVDEKRVDELFTAVQRGRIGAYLKRHPEDRLEDKRKVQ